VTLTHKQVTDLLRASGLRPSRALGQNFVVDPNTVRRIARLAAIGPGDRVVEIGAGLGSLTLALADTGAQVTAVEIDRRLVPLLRTVVAGRDVVVVEGDGLELPWADLLGPGSEGVVLVANLPYNVAVPLIVTVLEQAQGVDRMLVMVQREVAERLAARPGDPAYGAVSVKVAYYAEATLVGRVPPSVFTPRPRVESELVRIVRRPAVAVDPAQVDGGRLFAVVRAGFAQRRKMLRRSLAGVVAPDAFAVAGISPEARAEELSVSDWGRLAAVGGGGSARAGGEAGGAGTGSGGVGEVGPR
jgi:16S rRNA (adenine1518-N6/adenine1519-N6)-dimethyltransferase